MCRAVSCRVVVACDCVLRQSKKGEVKVQEVVKLGPTVKEGEMVFGVAHIFASFNDTFVVSSSSVCGAAWMFFPGRSDGSGGKRIGGGSGSHRCRVLFLVACST